MLIPCACGRAGNRTETPNRLCCYQLGVRVPVRCLRITRPVSPHIVDVLPMACHARAEQGGPMKARPRHTDACLFLHHPQILVGPPVSQLVVTNGHSCLLENLRAHKVGRHDRNAVLGLAQIVLL